MSDPSQSQQPTQEELRAYVEQLRAADPAELIVQAYSLLGTGAEVKLGRPDARVLIDAIAGMADALEGKLDKELFEQMRAGVVQLQTAQVQAEQQQAATADETAGSGDDAAGGGADQDRAQQESEQRMTDRLWVPGREPPPGR